MDASLPSGLLDTLGLPACRHLATTVLLFLAPEDLNALAAAAAHSPNYFLQLIRNARFLSQFVNRTDKSLYFTFCGDPQYRLIETAQVAAVAQEGSGVFLQLEAAWEGVMCMLRERVPQAEEDLELLGGLLTDPELPLPRLKRETQGMYCTSPFQLFLVDCTFRQDDQEYFCFDALREFLTVEREEAYLRQVMGLVRERHTCGAALRKVMQLRYTPYEVTGANFAEFLLEGNEVHNLLVGLFALTDIVVEAAHAYIARIDDPLHRLVELLIRYSIFRNFVLAVEEYLGFAFKIYENVYHDAVEQDPRKPQFRFWRPALTKWFLRMDYLHQQGTQVYFHCLTRLRNAHLIAALGELTEQDQQRYGKMLNAVQLSGFESELGEEVYGWGLSSGSEVGLFLDAHPENYEMLVMEFNEYVVDVSVNEQTVHWCGHSRHQLEQPYLTYEQALLALNHRFTHALLTPIHPLPAADTHQLLKIDAEYLSVLQVKNRTLKQVVETANREYCLGGEWALRFDFDEADRKLEFFNAKALILAAVDEHERPFYSIPPLCAPSKLIDMLDTNDSSNNNSEEEVYEYHSEEEQEHYSEEEDKPRERFQDEMSLSKKPMSLKKVFAEDLEAPPCLKSKQLELLQEL